MKKCPVCETELGETIPKFCKNCKWETGEDITLQVFLDMPSHEDIEEYRKKLEKARKIWSERYLPQEKEELEFIQGGTFSMGNNGSYAHELPIHSVAIEDFYISRYPISQKHYERIMKYNPSHFKGKEDPVEQVTWYDAIMFCNLLSTEEGFQEYYNISNVVMRHNNIINAVVSTNENSKGYRLPTESEWEYAARGGRKTKGLKYSGSNTLEDVAWSSENSSLRTQRVGQKPPNELGLYDMNGNVWEWCWDWKSSYENRFLENPKGSYFGLHKVIRGGSWFSSNSMNAINLSVSSRHEAYPHAVDYTIGFRIAKSK